MAEHQKAPAGAQTTEKVEGGLLDQIVQQGRMGKDSASSRARQESDQGIRGAGAGRLDDRFARHRIHDQRAHRADRPPALRAVERDSAPRRFPEAGRILARAEVSAGPERNQRHAEDQGPQLLERKSCCGTCSGLRNSTRARSSRRSTKKSSASSAALPSARWWATTSSAKDRKISSCWKRFPTWPRRRMRRSSRPLRRKC